MIYFKHAARDDRTNASTYHNIARLYMKLGRLGEAESALLRAREIDPHNAFTHANLGMIYKGQGKKARAVQSFRTALSFNPGIHDARRALRELEND